PSTDKPEILRGKPLLFQNHHKLSHLNVAMVHVLVPPTTIDNAFRRQRSTFAPPRCLITKPTRRVIRCLTNKSTRKEVAAERRSVPRSGAGWQAKVFGFGFLHLVYGSS